MINNKKINAYYNRQASCKILSGLFNNVNLFSDERYHINENDFCDKLHRTLYVCLYNLANQGLEKIEIADIEAYLDKNNITAYKLLFDNEENVEWLQLLKEDISENNFDYYYNLVKKMSLLRGYISAGVDVSSLLDKAEIDVIVIKNQEERLDNMSIQDIIDYFDTKISEVKSSFNFRDSEHSSQAGKGDLEMFKALKNTPPYGIGTEMEFLNTITRGFLPSKYWLCSMATGSGKSRNSIKRCVLASCTKYYDVGLKKWVDNPSKGNHPSLYIGTELSMEEIKQISWSCVSGVSQDRIIEGRITPEEEERVLEAISILENSPIYIENNDDYNGLWIRNTIEKYKREKNIELVTLDYIELTPALVAEYCQKTRGISPREDSVLLDFSTQLKNIANDLQICIIAYTQTNDLANDPHSMARDNRCIKGCKSMPNKCDVGYSVFKPSEKEMKLIEPYIQKLKGYRSRLTPNACYTIYKNRGGKYNAIKLWCYVNLGNMEAVGLFCTDYGYNLVDIEETKIVLE